ncbi:MAG: glutamine amidotransferase [Eubacterium sp.]|nr:glutamine amidotransferase [Eubacterium sp.]
MRLSHLYPAELSLYGDTGNIICIKNTLERLGFGCEVNKIEIGDRLGDFDFLFIGGGQDREMNIIKDDLRKKSEALSFYIESGKTVLAICGGFQLLGEYFKTAENEMIKLSGALPFYTESGEKRLIGNIVFQSDFGKITGFENHAGRTFLSDTLSPLGRVIIGYGNNGRDKSEGVKYKNTFGTYAHGPVLVKNPELKYAIINSFIKTADFSALDDSLDKKCHDELILRFT